MAVGYKSSSLPSGAWKYLVCNEEAIQILKVCNRCESKWFSLQDIIKRLNIPKSRKDKTCSILLKMYNYDILLSKFNSNDHDRVRIYKINDSRKEGIWRFLESNGGFSM